MAGTFEIAQDEAGKFRFRLNVEQLGAFDCGMWLAQSRYSK